MAAFAWIESWEGTPDFGLATYLFWPMLVGAVVLIGFATRVSSAEADDHSTLTPSPSD